MRILAIAKKYREVFRDAERTTDGRLRSREDLPWHLVATASLGNVCHDRPLLAGERTRRVAIGVKNSTATGANPPLAHRQVAVSY